MDACLWPGFCKELKLRPQGWSSQLPAVVRYVRGKEAARLPAPGAGDDLGLRPNFISQVTRGPGSCSKSCMAGFLEASPASADTACAKL
jgi:hypothetical protein